ncbi:MAG: Fic family protein [Melioribacteraceae bacterium]|nr:Fic family protein [Melioribacteraceae bacterium]MCF8353181.1 Fic family protein [Melioribacteraceae bacterium]MCF8395155.1 Fic family protein [Melioribacteraceae bacterium]MCF8418022.1 Fic family protein [Melioribacteraceae bacterium]
MMNNKHISQRISVFHERIAPEEGTLVGYGAIIDSYNLNVPIPETLTIISDKKRQYKSENWQVLTSRHLPEDTLYKQLVFALKYEGVNLLILKKLFEALKKTEAKDLFQIEPLSKYNRKLWFLYEWLLSSRLEIDDLKKGNYVLLVDDKKQHAISEGEKSNRHRIINNLLGTRDFCPMITKTDKLENFISSDLLSEKNNYLTGIKKDILLRASAFLLLKDSKASFNIEGETPLHNRALRWGRAIGQAGKSNLTKNELLRLQQIVIENDRFVNMGFRKVGGFVGEHDRVTQEPIPEHISARHEDLEILLDGLISTHNLLLKDNLNAVLAAAIIAFGFVFIHPFEDGNGRIHRYLIHHILTKKEFTQHGIIFPVSASILNHIENYREVLESFSQPLLELIEWDVTERNNIKVLNETIDYYRYFDATKQAEFLFECVQDTVKNIIPAEVLYLINYDLFKQNLDDKFDMPDKTVALLIGFLEQNEGKLSKRAREKEFAQLTDEEVSEIENTYNNIFS